MTARQLAQLRSMSNVAAMPDAYDIAARQAEGQMRDERLPPAFDLPCRSA